ncbi:MAG: hypothetical protein MUF34_01470 [Polyangiaceae bacterium]|jgi:hypothetical protein|nr:hypothetical protein [Polyangiaceae bacterium]
MTFAEFEAKFNELLTNDTTAFMGNTKLTANESEELRRFWQKLPEADRAKALELLQAKGIDVRTWV